MSKVGVIIPALNEAGNIGRLVREVKAVIEADVIVVDNSSTDDTAGEASRAGARVIFEARRGYGFACAAGVAAAGNSEILVFMDGDYSNSPADLPKLIEPLINDDADLVLGSRALGHITPGAMPLQQRFGNWLASRLINQLYGTEITDLGPFRAVRCSTLALIRMQEMTYGWPTEMLVKCVAKSARIVEVPVGFHPRQAGRSKISSTVRGTLLAAWYILGVTIRYAIR